MKEKRLTLFINGWSSECGNCGKGCNPDQKTHEINLGYGITDANKKGCGIEWKYVASGMTGISKERLLQMRPDLVWVDFWEAMTPMPNIEWKERYHKQPGWDVNALLRDNVEQFIETLLGEVIEEAKTHSESSGIDLTLEKHLLSKYLGK